MTVKQIRARAKALQLKNYTRLNKIQLIWAIQKAEGNSDCFTRISDCGVLDCSWREDCQPGTWPG